MEHGSSFGYLSLFVDPDPSLGVQCAWNEGAWGAGCRGAPAIEPRNNEFSHPVLLQLDYIRSTRCVMGTTFTDQGLFFSAVGSNNGNTCGAAKNGWSADGYWIKRSFTQLPSWVSAPAVVPNDPGVALFWAANLQKGPSVPRHSSLVTVKADSSGPYIAEADGYIFTGTIINAAPVALLNAWGLGVHAIVVATQTKGVQMFYWDRVSAGPRYTFDVSAALPSPGTWHLCGNYMAASETGTLLVVAHDTVGKEAFLVAISNSVNGPAPVAPAPAPTSSSGGSPNSVVIAVFASLGGVAAAAGAIVLLAPRASFNMPGVGNVVPADVIKAGAAGVWGAASAGAGMAARALRGVGGQAYSKRESTSFVRGGGYGGATTATSGGYDVNPLTS